MPRLTAVLVVVATALALSSCDSSRTVSDGKPPGEVLALAKQTLDETSGVHIALSGKLPDGVSGITAADGVGTHAPAFDGSITVSLSGQSVPVPVIAVDGKVYAQIPFTPGWSDVDPADYGAPDPARLMSPDGGFSALLTATKGAKQGDTVRGGAGNKDVLTEITGTVPGGAVQGLIPSASGDFDVTYTVTSDGRLATMRLTGIFYPGSPAMTYTVDFTDYGTSKDIAAP